MIDNINKFTRFSMANCLTVRMDKCAKRRKLHFRRTYTAHIMTTDLFLKKVMPGVKIKMPYPDLWPKGFIKTYKIPQKIHTFIFSTFNEIHHPSYTFHDNIRYVIPMAPSGKTDRRFIPLLKQATKVPKLTKRQFSQELLHIDEKVDTIWEKPLKILIFYDHSTASREIKKRAISFNTVAKNILPNWPIIQVNERPRKYKSADMWPHYSGATYLWVLKQIERIEKEMFK